MTRVLINLDLQSVQIKKSPIPAAKHSIRLSEATCSNVLLEMKGLREFDLGGHNLIGNKVTGLQ